MTDKDTAGGEGAKGGDAQTVSAEEYQKLQTELEKTKSRAQRFEGQLTDVQKQLESWKGFDPDDVRGKLEDYELMREKQAKEDPEELKKWQKAKEEEIRGVVGKELSALQQERDKLTAQLHELTVVDKAMNELGQYFNEDTHPFIKQLVREHVDVDEQDFIIKDPQSKDGEPRYNSKAQRMKLSEWAEELTKKYPSMARAQMTPGAKSEGTKANGATGNYDLTKYMRMTEEQRKSIPVKERGELAMQALRNVKI